MAGILNNIEQSFTAFWSFEKFTNNLSTEYVTCVQQIGKKQWTCKKGTSNIIIIHNYDNQAQYEYDILEIPKFLPKNVFEKMYPDHRLVK